MIQHQTTDLLPFGWIKGGWRLDAIGLGFGACAAGLASPVLGECLICEMGEPGSRSGAVAVVEPNVPQGLDEDLLDDVFGVLLPYLAGAHPAQQGLMVGLVEGTYHGSSLIFVLEHTRRLVAAAARGHTHPSICVLAAEGLSLAASSGVVNHLPTQGLLGLACPWMDGRDGWGLADSVLCHVMECRS